MNGPNLINKVLIRGVHSSVRFGLDPKNQPNRITVFLLKINRTRPKTGSNQTGPVKSGFFRKKPGKIRFRSWFFFWFFLNWLSLL